MSSGADEPWDPIGPPGPRVKRPKRTPHFERPPQPHDWRWVVGGIGKTLITLGLLMFAFVGYQLWGTGIQTARAQDSLENEFQRKLEATTTLAPTTLPPTTVPPTTIAPNGSQPPPDTTVAPTTTVTVPIAPPPPSKGGEPIAHLEIPSIGLEWFVVQGVTKNDLKNGPGHFRETPMPGELGNAAIAGHRTTYGAPFEDLDLVAIGDPITVQTLTGTFVYSVTDSFVVEADEYGEVASTDDPTVATLTLVTCTPKYTSRQRLAVRAVLSEVQEGQVMAPPPVTLPPDTENLPDELAETTTIAATSTDGTINPTDTTPTDTASTGTAATPTATTVAGTDGSTTDTEPAAAGTGPIDDGFSGGWFDDSAAVPDAIFWGLALLAVGIGAYFVGKRFKRLYVCFLVGFFPFVVVLYFFFENVNRLLPPGL
ncbi:MAG: sortase [Ilumatobacteraceae bacterium]